MIRPAFGQWTAAPGDRELRAHLGMAADGGPVLVQDDNHLAALLSLDILRDLAERVPLVVRAARDPGTGLWHVALDGLSVAAAGAAREDALVALVEEVRCAVRRVLRDRRAPPAERALAVRCWLEDIDARLRDTLGAAAEPAGGGR